MQVTLGSTNLQMVPVYLILHNIHPVFAQRRLLPTHGDINEQPLRPRLSHDPLKLTTFDILQRSIEVFLWTLHTLRLLSVVVCFGG